MRNRRGSVLALLVLLLPVLALLVGVAVADFGLVSLEGARIQHAADAGALAGAAVLASGDTTAAVETARWVAGVNWPRSGLEVEVAVGPGETVGVSLSARVPLMFGAAIGIGEATVGAQASATEDDGTIRLVE